MSSFTLDIRAAGQPPRVQTFQEGAFHIGRDSGHIVLGDPNVSGRHGELRFERGTLTYTDLGSTNGSFLGHATDRLQTPIRLIPGMAVRLGSSWLTVQAIDVPAPAGGTAVLPAQAPMPQPAAPQPAVPAAIPQPAAPQPAMPAPMPQPALPHPAVPAAMPQAAAPQPPMPAPVPQAAPQPAMPQAAAAAPRGPGVRHDYPVAIRDASLGTAIKLMSQTLPYALARFGILVGASLAAIVWAVLTLVGAAFLGARVPLLGWIWLVIGLAVGGGVWRLALRYVLYLIKCGHVAVLTELITRGQIACGNKSMFRHGKDVVTERFGQVNALFVLDALIDGVVRAFNRTLDFVANLLPIPGIQSVTGLVQAVMRASTTYIDETLFSYNLARGDANVWASSRDGLVYYAQNARDVLKTGIWVVVLDKALTFAAWVVLLGPAFVLTWLMPAAVQSWGALFAFFVAALFASNVRRAFLQPLFLTMVMTRFHVSVQGQPIHEQWDARLTSLSDKFRQIKDKAMAPSPAPAPALPGAQAA